MSVSEGFPDLESYQYEIDAINRAYDKRGIISLATASGLSFALTAAFALGLRAFSSDPSTLSTHVYQESLLAEETLSFLETKKESSTRPLFSYEPKGLASILDTAFRNNDGTKVSLESAISFMQQRVSSLHNSSAYKEHINYEKNLKKNIFLDVGLCVVSTLALHAGAMGYIVSNNKRKRAELVSLSSARDNPRRSSIPHQG